MSASFFDLKARKAQAAADGAAPSKSNVKGPDNSRLQPWIEKYRPKNLDEVTSQDHTITVLQRTLQAANLPHMLFYGPPGTGKTSTILALAKSLFGPELFRTRVLELNASDERGISIVRTKIKDFAKIAISNVPTGLKLASGEKYTDKFPCPPFKIIILDEADSMTQDAQSALRRTMETYSRITRFCLCCNYVTRIIDPLASRCSKFRFKRMDQENAGARLTQIARAEGVKFQPEAIDALLRCSEGDLRRAITYLQSAARLVGTGSFSGPATSKKKVHEDVMDIDEDFEGTVDVRTVEEIAGVVPDDVVDHLYESCEGRKRGDVYNALSKAVNVMVADGWSANQVISQLYQKVMFDEAVLDRHKMKIGVIFSEVDKRLVDGADEHLMTLDLCLRIAGILAT